jgi:hypothetical protein
MLNLSPVVGTGGSPDPRSRLYYAVSGVDGAGNESVLSFIVRAVIADDDSTVTLAGLSFRPEQPGSTFIGSTPAQLFQVATNQAVAAQFTDTGLPKLQWRRPTN